MMKTGMPRSFRGLAQVGDHVLAGAAGEDEVEQDEVGLVLKSLPQPPDAVDRQADLVAALAQVAGHGA